MYIINGSKKNSKDTISIELLGVTSFSIQDSRTISTKRLQNGSILSDHVSKEPESIKISFTVGDSVVENYTGEGFLGKSGKDWFGTQLGSIVVNATKMAIDRAVDKVITPEVQRKLTNGYVILNGLYQMAVEQIEYFSPSTQRGAYVDDSIDWHEPSEYSKSIRETISRIEESSNIDMLWTINSKRHKQYSNMILSSMSITDLKNSVGGFEVSMEFKRAIIGQVEAGSFVSASPKAPTGIGQPSGDGTSKTVITETIEQRNSRLEQEAKKNG